MKTMKDKGLKRNFAKKKLVWNILFQMEADKILQLFFHLVFLLVNFEYVMAENSNSVLS